MSCIRFPSNAGNRLTAALYKASLPLALLIWLLPMLAVLVTSIRSSDELSQGDYWGWPKHFALIENYGTALTQTPMLHYFANSVLITVPSVIGAIVLASMAGFALGDLPVPGQYRCVVRVRRRQLRADPDPDDPGARHGAESRLVQYRVGAGDFPRVVPDRLLHAVPAQLHQAVAVRADRGGARGRRERMDGLCCASCCR